ncbi:hypothetical protein MKEN_00133900 [Mycena kentingensis (nom. inval.)]|nr:hypothetical protein MKEN_00133900 [Mycena kentingensis (nom. inval.)]
MFIGEPKCNNAPGACRVSLETRFSATMSSTPLTNLIDALHQTLRVPLQVEQLREVTFDIPQEVDIFDLVQEICKYEELEKDSWHVIKTTIKEDTLYIRQFCCTLSQGIASTVTSHLMLDIGRVSKLELTVFVDTQGRCAKQADNGILPLRRTDWPSVVVEVGYKETMTELYQHADDWMVMTAGVQFPLKLVILVKLYPETKEMRLEFLQRAPSRNSKLPHHAIPVPNLGPFEWSMDSVSDANISAIPTIKLPLDLLYDEIPARIIEAGPVEMTRDAHLQEWVESCLKRL